MCNLYICAVYLEHFPSLGGLSVRRNRYLPGTAHSQHSSSLEVGECCSADHLKRRMLHCEQLCFKARSHQGMFSETSGSILSCYSILPHPPSTKPAAHSRPKSPSSVRMRVKQKGQTHTPVTCNQLQLNTTYVIRCCHF